MTLTVARDDPRRDDVRALLARHLVFAHEKSPEGSVHALDVDALVVPAITFFAARHEGELLGVGALKELDPAWAEIKSMHTRAEARGQGVGRALVAHLLDAGRTRGYARISLETGNSDDFAPARALYAAAGFEPCPLFGEYVHSSFSYCMTIEL